MIFINQVGTPRFSPPPKKTTFMLEKTSWANDRNLYGYQYLQAGMFKITLQYNFMYAIDNCYFLTSAISFIFKLQK